MEPGPAERPPADRPGDAGLPRFSVVDVETSGLSTRRHRILQIAVVTVDAGCIVDEWVSFIRLRWPWQRVGPRQVHGISRSTLRGAPLQRHVMAEFAKRCDGTVFVAHNVEFDWSFIDKTARKSGIALRIPHHLCTLDLSRRLDPERCHSHRLTDVGARYGIANGRPHDALADARATALVLPHLLAAHDVTAERDLADLYDR